MTSATDSSEEQRGSSLTRVGGASMIVALGLHIFLNAFLKEFPPEDPTTAELKEYLTREAGTWALVHGFRYIALACVVLFAAGLFSRTCSSRTDGSVGWGIVGLLGTAIWVTNAVVTNGIETLAFLNTDLLSQQQDLFWLLFELTRVLFSAEVVTWSIGILGFGIAGWRSATIPKWIAVLGLVNVAAGMLFGVFLVSALTDGWATICMDVASITGLLWFLIVGAYMLVRGES